jgi:hypothetical protein
VNVLVDQEYWLRDREAVELIEQRLQSQLLLALRGQGKA